MTGYWLLGGTAGLATVGGYAEELARSRTATALALGAVVVLVKLLGALLAWRLRPSTGRLGGLRSWHRLSVLAGSAGSLLLTVYGGLLVVVGAAVLVGLFTPDGAVDRRVLTWHVLLWDLWFLIWGVALGRATWNRVRAGAAPTVRLSR